MDVHEDYENQIVWVTTEKKKNRIKIYVPMNGTATWKIAYEDGRQIPELKGAYTSPKNAIEAIVKWERKAKTNNAVKHDEWFGPDQKKQLRTKRGTRAKTDNS